MKPFLNCVACFVLTLLLATIPLSASEPSATSNPRLDNLYVDSLGSNSEAAHPIVPAFERFAEVEAISQVELGTLLLNELNCTSCHQSESTWPVAPKQAPILSEIGSRALPSYFESFILNPHLIKPGTTMPSVISNQADAEAIAHFLASSGTLNRQNVSSKNVAIGQQLFHSVGCVACHNPQGDGEQVTISTSVPLGSVDNKYSMSGLTQFILNPLHVRPSGRMPKFDLSEEEARSIAAFLLRKRAVDSRINYTAYEGDWEELPDFSQLTPTIQGTTSGFNLSAAGKKNQFGIVFTGYWETKTEAKYKFRLGSDDGSRIVIDGNRKLNNDGIHAMKYKEKEHTIPAGIHEVRIEYFDKGGDVRLDVTVSGNGIQSMPLDSLLRATREPPSAEKQEPVFTLDATKAARGKTLFTTSGCANCHEMESRNVADVKPTAKPLKQINLTGGCLDGTGGAPKFNLTEQQSKSLVAAIAHLKNPPTAVVNPAAQVHKKLMTLNCYACHDRELDGGFLVGGVIDRTGEGVEIFGRKEWFKGTQAEMGDEGQHPPSLKAAGAKLQPQWLDQVLTKGTKVRPYMLTRMPMFGKSNLGSLANDLKHVDQLQNVKQIVQSESVDQVKKHGRFFTGDEALSCIKCHTFGPHPATGVQSIDMTTMTQRLNKDWFQVYMLKPSRFRKGTRMPESFPSGNTFYKDILDGDADKQIDSIWQFLSDGVNAAKPKGLVRAKNELKADKTPIVYRNFIEGAGARAIGVAYPEQVNLALDAEQCRLALIWQENFIDASRHWTGRGQGFEPPLGENVLTFHDSVTFTTQLDDGKWPGSASLQTRPVFKGYRFEQTTRRPMFRYQVGDVTIEDMPTPMMNDKNEPVLKRKLVFKSTGSKKIYYRAMVGKKPTMEIVNGKVVVKSEKLKCGFSCSTKMNVLPNNIDTIVEIDLSDGEASLLQTYDW